MLYYSPRPEGHRKQAEMVKLVDTQRSGRCARKGMGVRVPLSALRRLSGASQSALQAVRGVFVCYEIFPPQSKRCSKRSL